MGIMFQTFRPDRELTAKSLYLLEQWNKLTTETKENIIKDVFGDGNNQSSTQIKDQLVEAINNASCARISLVAPTLK